MAGGGPLIDLGRGNPETGPPPHVVEVLAGAARRDDVHGYAPFRGLPELRAALAERYRSAYGVSLDPDTEVAIVPGTKTAIVELCLALAEEGQTVVLPDPYYPDYPSGPALAGADIAYVPLDPGNGWPPDFTQAPAENVAAVYLNYPSNPAAVAVPDGAFEEAVAYAQTTGAAIVHDFAYGDLVFDGREPKSFLATPGAKEVGVELFSMSKSYGMAGWRVGFVVGNAEIVERINLLNDHCRVGIFRPIQEACIAALTGPQDSVAERRDTYQRRRDRVREVLEPFARAAHLRGHLLHLARAARGRDLRDPAHRAPRRARARRGVRAERRRPRAAQPRGRRRDARAWARAPRHRVQRSGLDPRAASSTTVAS